MKEKKYYALSMAVLWALVFGSAVHDWTLGICLGILMGISYGLFGSEDDHKEKK